jgi:hypothetical protein
LILFELMLAMVNSGGWADVGDDEMARVDDDVENLRQLLVPIVMPTSSYYLKYVTRSQAVGSIQRFDFLVLSEQEVDSMLVSIALVTIPVLGRSLPAQWK